VQAFPVPVDQAPRRLLSQHPYRADWPVSGWQVAEISSVSKRPNIGREDHKWCNFRWQVSGRQKQAQQPGLRITGPSWTGPAFALPVYTGWYDL